MMPLEIKKFQFKNINSKESEFLSNISSVFDNPTDKIY